MPPVRRVRVVTRSLVGWTCVILCIWAYLSQYTVPTPPGLKIWGTGSILVKSRAWCSRDAGLLDGLKCGFATP